jgi:phenylpropionate dioxygenase-like ring-hydroxylating dioxygenase large terminal subunit
MTTERPDVIKESGGLELPPLGDTWYIAGWAPEFEPSLPVSRMIAGEQMVLYRVPGGRMVGLEDRCPHRWAPLSLGRVEGEHIRCMYHGVKYGSDGQCVEVPGQDLVPKTLCVRSYPIVEKHHLVWVWIGDPAKAHPSRVPDLSVMDEPQWRLYQGVVEYKANHALISDNLLDLTHVRFLHERTLGRPVATVSGTPSGPPQVRAEPRRLDNGVRAEGWYPGSRIIAIPKSVPDGDLWMRSDYIVPGILISRGGMYAPGTATECEGLPPGTQHVPLSDGLAIHAVTPMRARNTRYFYLQGFRVSDAEKDETDAIWQVSQEAFVEDLKMIEAQQENVALDSPHRMGGIAADRGLVMFRSLMKRLISDRN